jgi:hypothetical protein
MPLPLPNLDDRRWTDLVEEGRALIPRYAPRWTDHNVHDPGITLIELFAWLVEQDVYQLNRVPEGHRRKFLALIGFGPRPPSAAQTILSLSPEPGTGGFTLPAGVVFEATDPEGHVVPFRTLHELTVGEAQLAAVQVDDGNGVLRDHTRDWREGLPIPALGPHPQPGAAFYLGFTTLPATQRVTFALWFAGPGNTLEERRRIVEEAAAQRIACRPGLPDIRCGSEVSPELASAKILPPHHAAQVSWEVFTSTAHDPWMPLPAVAVGPAPAQVLDNTRALTLDGIVAVNLPSTIVPTTLGNVPAVLFYVRCRLVAGAYDAPPMLLDGAANAVRAEQAVPVWQRFTIPTGVTPGGPAPIAGATVRLQMTLDHSGTVQTLTCFDPTDPTASGLPAIPVLGYQAPASAPGQISLELVLAGIGNGRPHQQIVLPEAPIQLESLRLYTHAGGDWQEWTRRTDLDASERTDWHFVLDATSGAITFGDGEHGRVPPEGAAILASYRVTRAAPGNVAGRTVGKLARVPRNRVLLAGLSVAIQEQLSRVTTNRAPATGGAAAETLVAATGRAVETLYAHERLLELCTAMKCQTLDLVDRSQLQALPTPTRAVNLLDIERLALHVPGTRIARARAWANSYPAYPCLEAPGVVAVVVLPDMPVARPVPSTGLLRAVWRYLDRRRSITTRVEVVGPQYLEVHVNVDVRARPHTDRGRIKTQIEQALNTFLDPRRGGPAGLGWPFGRDVYRSELLQLIDSVPGVDHVLELSLSAGDDACQCGNIPLCPTWLVTPGRHRIEVIAASAEVIRRRADTALQPCAPAGSPEPAH